MRRRWRLEWHWIGELWRFRWAFNSFCWNGSTFRIKCDNGFSVRFFNWRYSLQCIRLNRTSRRWRWWWRSSSCFKTKSLSLSWASPFPFFLWLRWQRRLVVRLSSDIWGRKIISRRLRLRTVMVTVITTNSSSSIIMTNLLTVATNRVRFFVSGCLNSAVELKLKCKW